MSAEKKLPAGWEVKKLGDIAAFFNGLWTGKKPPYVKVGVIRNTNFSKNATLDDSDIAYLDVEIRLFEKRKLEYGDIILEKSGGGPKQPVGRVIEFCKEDGNYSFSNFTSSIRANSDFVYSSYLHRYLNYVYSIGITESMQSHSTGIRNLKLEEYKQLDIPLPPLSEQKRIVAILDEAFQAIDKAKENAQKNLANARELFEGYLNQVFSNPGKEWEEKKLGEILQIKHGYAFEGEYFSNEGKYVLLTPGNFFEKGGYRDRGEKQKYFTGPIPKDFVLHKNDLLVAMTEQAAGLLGSTIIVPEDNKFLHNQRLGLITPLPGSSWDKRFIPFLFNTKYIRESIESSASGVKVRHTSPSKIYEISTCIPRSTNLQKEIIGGLDSISSQTQRLESIYTKKLAALDELKKAILQKAFSGEL
jgi:type I restriction enzyme S subunit